ncbi:MAG: hypothetical protein AAGA92_04705 [Planctomycetota bacterium]
MDLSDALDAISAAFFALLGVWAALDRRHWFLRFAVVSVFLFASLLVPAFEIVLEFGVLILLINAGVWLAMLSRNWPPRLSMESALLAMVVVAVLSAVAGAVPSLDARTWAFCMSVACGGAAIALGCVQLVFGSRRLLVRIAFFPAFVAAALASIAVIRGIKNSALGRGFTLLPNGQTLVDFAKDHGGAFVLGTVLILAALLLARETQWFHNAPEDTTPSRWRLVGSRWTLATLVTAIFAPLFLIFLRLLFPTPLPPIELPNPNGYDDIVAAGRIAPLKELQGIARDKKSGVPLSKAIVKLEPVYELIDQSLAKPIVSPHYHPNESEQSRRDTEAELSALMALSFRADAAIRQSKIDRSVDDLFNILRVGRSLKNDIGHAWTASRWSESIFINLVSSGLPHFDPGTCRQIAQQCISHDSTRQPVKDLTQRRRIIDDNHDWKNNLWNTLADISGEDHYAWIEDWQKSKSVDMRLLITQLGVQAYYSERGALPASLDQLVPNYLDAIPLDPFGDGPLRSVRGRRSLTVYSVGRDGLDQTNVVSDTPITGDDVSVPAPRYGLAECLWFMLADRVEPLARTLQQILVESGRLIRDNAARLEQANVP